MLFNNKEIDDIDDESQDLAPDEEDDANLNTDFSDDEEPDEAETKVIETQDDDDSDESAAYDRIAEALDEKELEKVASPLTLVKPADALFRLYEQNNQAYRDAVTAYFEEKNYQQAIENFNDAIADASQRIVRDLTEAQAGEIIAKSMYWQAEAYVKTQNISQAVETFKALVQNCHGHYLTLAAQRRVDELNAKDA